MTLKENIFAYGPILIKNYILFIKKNFFSIILETIIHKMLLSSRIGEPYQGTYMDSSYKILSRHMSICEEKHY